MAFQTPEAMEAETSGDARTLDFRFVHRVKATADPDTDTLAGILAHMSTFGFFYGAPFSGFPTARCKSVLARVAKADVKKPDGVPTWYCTVNSLFSTRFENDPQGQSGGGSSSDPLQRPTRIAIRNAKWTDAARKDIAGNEVTNRAKDVVVREKKRARKVYVLDKAVSTYDAEKLDEARPDGTGGYLFSRNDEIFSPCGVYGPLFGNPVIPTGRGSIEEFTADLAFDNGGRYVQLHCEIHVDALEHEDRFWNEGFRAFLDEDDEQLGIPPVLIMDDKTGGFVSTPQPLAFDGTKLQPGQPKVELAFQYYPLKDWSNLGLP